MSSLRLDQTRRPLQNIRAPGHIHPEENVNEWCPLPFIFYFISFFIFCICSESLLQIYGRKRKCLHRDVKWMYFFFQKKQKSSELFLTAILSRLQCKQYGGFVVNGFVTVSLPLCQISSGPWLFHTNVFPSVTLYIWLLLLLSRY